MESVFCKDKKWFCECLEDCRRCEFARGSGVISGGVAHDVLVTLFGADYDLDRLRELVEADRDKRCVVFKFGIGSTVYRTWVRPNGKFCFVSGQTIDTVEDMVNAEKWSNAYATREAAEQALKDGEKDGTVRNG